MGSQMDCLSAPIEGHHGNGSKVKHHGHDLAKSSSSSSLSRSSSTPTPRERAPQNYHRTRPSSSHGQRRSHHHHHVSTHKEKQHAMAHKHRIKILFLDVDGVLNGENYGYGGVDDSLLFLLKTIIDSTQCKIVLSTTWRLNQSARATLLHFMKARADINVEDIIIGDTPSLKGKKRAFEIETFLNSEEFQSQYYCTKWCAIDDLALNQQYPLFMRNHFVRTNYRTGITSSDAYHVVQILNKDIEYSNSYDY